MTLRKKFKLFTLGRSFKDKMEILSWAITGKPPKSDIILRLERNLLFKCRKGEINDLWMATNYNETKRIQKDCKDKFVLDVGANIGLYSLSMSQVAKEVLSFEPFKKSLRALEENILLNGKKNIKTIGKACYDSIGRVKLNICKLNDGANSIKLERGAGLIDVESVTIDSLNVNPGLIKIDVEGAELEVLRGAAETIKRNRPGIFLEILPGSDREEIMKFFRSLDYMKERVSETDYYFYPKVVRIREVEDES